MKTSLYTIASIMLIIAFIATNTVSRKAYMDVRDSDFVHDFRIYSSEYFPFHFEFDSREVIK